MRLVKLGELFKITSGGTPSKSKPEYYENGTVPWIRTGDLKSKYINESSDYITEDAVNNSSAKLFPRNTVLIAMYGATIGATSILNIDATTNQACAAFLPSEYVLPEYLYYFFKVNNRKIISLGVGGAQPNISATILKTIKISVPSLEIQQKIIDVLEKAENVIENRKEQIGLVDELVKSKFIEMFGDPFLNSKELPTKNFEEIVRLQRGFDLPTYARDTSGKINVWGSNGVLSKHSSAKVEEPGVITGRSGSIGNVYYTLEPYWPLNTTLFSKNTFGNNVIYLSYLLKFYKLERFSNGTGVPTLNRNLLDGQKIIDVPLEKQNQFADFVKQVDKLKFEMESSLKELENNFNSLMQRAFKGELFS